MNNSQLIDLFQNNIPSINVDYLVKKFLNLDDREIKREEREKKLKRIFKND